MIKRGTASPPQVHKDTGGAQGADDKVASPPCQTALANQSVIFRNPTSLNLDIRVRSRRCGPEEMKDDVHSAAARGCHFVLFFMGFDVGGDGLSESR